MVGALLGSETPRCSAPASSSHRSLLPSSFVSVQRYGRPAAPVQRRRERLDRVMCSGARPRHGSAAIDAPANSKAGRFYVNLTGFPFPLGALFFRQTIRKEVCGWYELQVVQRHPWYAVDAAALAAHARSIAGAYGHLSSRRVWGDPM